MYWPNEPKEAVASLSVLIIGAIYYVTPLRHWSNQKFFNDITEILRTRIVQIAGENDDPSLYSWKRLRGIFFSIIDNDKSLAIKASQAYFNGYIWTTLADLRVLAALMTIPSVALALLGQTEAWFAVGGFVSLALLTIPASFAVTKTHKKIGEQQIEIIEHNHLDTLREKLRGIRERSDPSHRSNQDGD
ncbi:hypothetical protein [Hyphococcus sp. DH-69]|uniref:hypothetical protein n=1 Tax=Hyphococcus formosus TaxID=3143534 RepID=UPI00398A674E